MQESSINTRPLKELKLPDNLKDAHVVIREADLKITYLRKLVEEKDSKLSSIQADTLRITDSHMQESRAAAEEYSSEVSRLQYEQAVLEAENSRLTSALESARLYQEENARLREEMAAAAKLGGAARQAHLAESAATRMQIARFRDVLSQRFESFLLAEQQKRSAAAGAAVGAGASSSQENQALKMQLAQQELDVRRVLDAVKDADRAERLAKDERKAAEMELKTMARELARLRQENRQLSAALAQSSQELTDSTIHRSAAFRFEELLNASRREADDLRRKLEVETARRERVEKLLEMARRKGRARPGAAPSRPKARTSPAVTTPSSKNLFTRSPLAGGRAQASPTDMSPTGASLRRSLLE
eukprot:gnl/Chilomastix_cuspidata/4089.p2 GENE.gnl/Chilomastix_cuspidata/4089~~gnl/Chilomastix_cuspidata/4089.p2  ORF type:complete len:361 (-),score=210.44 gnl/Chilomastix_cuspidata/4089:58-1140(-)